jgi:hypothetical protein
MPREPRVVPYARFQQRVRQVARTPLLRAVAAVATQVARRRIEGHEVKPFHVQEFSLAGVARTCLASSNEHRGGELTGALLSRLCHDYINVEEPRLEAGITSIDELLRPIIYEQFVVQYSPKENLARAYALCVRHMRIIPGAPSPDEWEAELGLDFAGYLRIGFALYTAFMSNDGRITWETLGADHVKLLWRPLDFEAFKALVERHFAAPIESTAEQAREKEVRGREKRSFNPLQARPVVIVGDELICPTPHFLLDKIGAAGIYYTGVELFGQRFTDALGSAFERYVGEHLRLIPEAIVHPEIVYAKGQNKSCDYIVEMKRAILLVEVKTARPLLAYRQGDDPEESLSRIRTARDQIVTTARNIRDRHPAFKHIPADLNLVGLVITLEPYFLTQSAQEGDTLASDVLTITSAWAHELENVTAYLAEQQYPDELLLEHWKALAGGSDEPITGVIGPGGPPMNPIVDADFEAALDFSPLFEERNSKRADHGH